MSTTLNGREVDDPKIIYLPMIPNANGTYVIDCRHAAFVSEHINFAASAAVTIDVVNFDNLISLRIMTKQEAVTGAATLSFDAKFDAKGRQVTATAGALDTWDFMGCQMCGGLHLHSLEKDV